MASRDDNVIEDFALLQVRDDEWDLLYKTNPEKIQEERTKKNLTITDFLVSCGLDPHRSYFRQLCSKTTKWLHPSKRINSPGREFRDAVEKSFNEQVEATSCNQSLETIIADWCLIIVPTSERAESQISAWSLKIRLT